MGEKYVWGLLILGVIILSFGYQVFMSEMEAEAFNRFSTTKITWWDAVFADYRIVPVNK